MNTDSLRLAEEITDLQLGDLKIIQAQNGYRFSIDPVLLCAFAKVPVASDVVDLGSGNGVIPLIVAGTRQVNKVVALEQQPDMVDRAQRSVALNGLQGQVEILQADVRALPEALAPESFDVVLSNPPYRPAGAGRIAPNDERAKARHELSGDFVDFIRSAAFLLKTNGRFCLIFLAERLAELMSEMRTFRLEPKRLRMVHSRQGQAAKLVLVEGRKNGKPGLEVEPPLFIYEGEGRDYTEEVLKMYDREA